MINSRTAEIAVAGQGAAAEPDPVVSKKQARRIAAQLFQVDETAVSARERRGSCWLSIAIPYQPEQMTFRAKTWFLVLDAAHKYLIECVKNNPSEAAVAASYERAGIANN